MSADADIAWRQGLWSGVWSERETQREDRAMCEGARTCTQKSHVSHQKAGVTVLCAGVWRNSVRDSVHLDGWMFVCGHASVRSHVAWAYFLLAFSYEQKTVFHSVLAQFTEPALSPQWSVSFILLALGLIRLCKTNF